MRGLAVSAFVTVVLVCLLANAAPAQIPPPGTVILNQAEARYSVGTDSRITFSGIVTTTVLALPDELHIGPRGNARANPGGEGSADDRTDGFTNYTDNVYVFDNDVLNAGLTLDVVTLRLSDTTVLPPGVSVTFADSTGQQLPQLIPTPGVFVLGAMQSGERRPIQVRVFANQPLYRALDGPLELVLEATSRIDASRTNVTVDRLMPPATVDPRTALSLKQTFRENTLSTGDIATLVVTVTNATDSARIDNVVVEEWAAPELDFVSSPQFTLEPDRGLVWSAGTLAAGASRSAVIKFAVNSRAANARAKAVANAGGVVETGDPVRAGPAVASVEIDNDVFANEGVIFGEVFVDANGDGHRDDGDEGVPGAAVFVESGEYAVTDSLGKFTLPRMFSGYRVVRLDEGSLPPDVSAARPSHTGAHDGSAQRRRGAEHVVHLLPGGNATVRFPVWRKPEPMAEVSYSVGFQEHVSMTKHARVFSATTLPSSYFALGKAELMRGSEEPLMPVVDYLRAHPDWRVLLDGHTDNIPIHTARFPSNMVLSNARASAVKRFLVERGVNPLRIIVRGFGETRPVATNETVEGRGRNRRVDISYVPPGAHLDSATRLAPEDLGALPDTFTVRILWEMHTNSPAVHDGALEVNVPERFLDARTTVHLDGQVLPGRDGRFDVRRFTRSRRLRCEVVFTAGAADTAFVRNVTARLLLSNAPPLRISVQTGGDTRTGEPATWSVEMPESRAAELDPRRTASVPRPRPYTPAADVADANAADTNAADAADADYQGASYGIIAPADGLVVSRSDQVRVRIRVPVGSRSALFVDGTPVGAGRVGRKIVNPSGGTEIVEWYGVKLKEGWNAIQLRSTRRIDGVAVGDTIRVARSASPAAIRPARNRVLVPADGLTSESIRFVVEDRSGLPVGRGVVVTVVEGASLFVNDDVQPSRPGLQVSSDEAGDVLLALAPSGDAGRHRVLIRTDGIESDCEVVFVAPNRPLLATGIVDLRLSRADAGGNGSFHGLRDDEDGLQADGEGRLFVQGTVPHGFSLTARVDTRQRFDDPLLKDISPERQYPIYGDGSALNFAAPSQGGNYVSLDRGESFVRWGDFRTHTSDGELLSYQRAITGLTTAFIRDGASLRTFATQTDFVTQKDELRADGTSGFYYLSRGPVVENSERIILETRDRYQLEKVLDVRPLARNRDYTINHWDGSLLFKHPVDATDAHFNPVFIVAIYEVETDREAQYLYGARGDLTQGRNQRLGATAVARTGAGEDYVLYGVDGQAGWRGLTFGGELARSEDGVTGNGNALKLESTFRNDRLEQSVYVRRIDGDFTNPSFRGSAHELASVKAGFTSRLRVSPEVTIEADGYSHELDQTDETRENARAVASYEDPRLGVDAGLRVARHEELGETRQALLSILGSRFHGPQGAMLTSVWEANLGSESVEDYPNRLKSRMTWPVSRRVGLNAAHEYQDASGRNATHQFSAGLESALGRGTRAYTKYAMNRTADDRRMGAVTGVKQDLRFRDGVSATFGIEGYQALSGDGQDEYVSVKSGLSRVVPGSHLIEGQYEYRWQPVRSRHLVRINASQHIRDGFSALLSDVLSVSPGDETEDEISYHGKLGLAYRPETVPVGALLAVKNAYERFTPTNPDAITWRLVVATDLNVMPVPAHELRFKYAYKRVEDFSFGESATSEADLVLGQYVYRFAQFWDVDVWGRVTRLRRGGTVGASSGIEVGRTFMGWLRVAAGYSDHGFDDPDISGTDAWARGFGLRVQIILSDWLLRDFPGVSPDPKRGEPPLPGD